MAKADETRAKILQEAATLFNQQGYAGSSMSDIMQATGLQKGGIYNHFTSKQALALEAFDFAFQRCQERLRIALATKQHAIERLQAILGVFYSFIEDPPIAGGCPILNTAIESDDANPALRDRAQAAMNTLRNSIRRTVERGIARGEIRPTVEADTVATVMISTLEGALMMSKLYDDPVHLERAIAHLNDYLCDRLPPPSI
ncbi:MULTISPECIES: TetR/AcrR family transcriptional regulator [Trichocoleus]|uniref:TetR/AcrR family transcriptional regulator n=1 Tax=Trichocoleus desertorum GB2-A4 TaxID=2933944 RepID=A0ABV0J3C3_9CYAN|nr:TetR/AcrR family transcriptional regulator [Trichocoleus sp. FACHB-46]MBD1861626.1 TetR/AcrR family transcriptional regulator [Trichocoleus sp. FACHB-46]